MARPQISLPTPDAVRQCADAEGRLCVRVTPGARSESLEVVAGRVQAKVRARPEGGKANEAVRSLLASALDIAVSRVEMLRGATSREKVFRIDE